ncbi:hypothetical protein E4T56_gene7629, partial [Termitomyces sp. T112]
MRPTLLLRLEREVRLWGKLPSRSQKPLPHPLESTQSQLLIPKKVQPRKLRQNSTVGHCLTEPPDLWRLQERQRAVRDIRGAFLDICQSQKITLLDVSLYEYALLTDLAPVELVMVDHTIQATSTYSSPPPELVWDPSDSTISSNLFHSPSFVALRLKEMGYRGGFLDLQTVRRRARRDTDGSTTLPTTPWPNFVSTLPDKGERPPVAQLLIASRKGYVYGAPVILTLPSPYVLPRFALLRRIFRDLYAQRLLSAVWKWTRVRQLYQFSSTAIAIMTGYFLQRTQEPVSDMSHKESFASFLRYWSLINELRRDVIISICDPEQPLQPPLMRRTYSNSSDPGRESLSEQLQPMSWEFQHLIIRDPYALTQNHAEGVSMKQLDRFARDCRDTLEGLDAAKIVLPTFDEEIHPLDQTISDRNIQLQGMLIRQQIAFIDRFKNRFRLQPLWHVPGYMEYEAALVDEVLSYFLIRKARRERRTKTKEDTSMVDVILDIDSHMESEDAADIVVPTSDEGNVSGNEKESRFDILKVEGDKNESGLRGSDGQREQTMEQESAETSPGGTEKSFTSGRRQPEMKLDILKQMISDFNVQPWEMLITRQGLSIDPSKNLHRIQRPWHVPGYKEYEADFVDEAFVAEFFSPSSSLLAQRETKSKAEVEILAITQSEDAAFAARVWSSPSSYLFPIQEAQPETKTKTIFSPEEDNSIADILQSVSVDSYVEPAQPETKTKTIFSPKADTSIADIIQSVSVDSFTEPAQPETKTRTVSSPEEVDTSVADIFRPLGVDSHAKPAQVLSSPSSSLLPIQEAQPETKTKTVSS